ncbi:MAG: hypothetical protein AB7I09_06920 [Planctomycetota bacterium]
MLEPIPNEQLLTTLSAFIRTRLDAIAEDSSSPAVAAAARREFLIGLASLFDTGELLVSQRLTRAAFDGVATVDEKDRRRHLTDRFSVHGRGDSMQHFFVSCGLTAVAGPLVAERLGRLKEMADARCKDAFPERASQGFSFVDLAYDIAGIHFALMVLEPQESAIERSRMESFVDAIPDLGLPENLGWNQFQREFGGAHWNRFDDLLVKIRRATAGCAEHP